MPRDVSYTQHPLGGVTEHRVRAATQARPPPVTLALLALHGLVAWRLWQADWSLSLGSVAAARASLASVQAALLVVYLWLLLRISDTSLHGEFPFRRVGSTLFVLHPAVSCFPAFLLSCIWHVPFPAPRASPRIIPGLCTQAGDVPTRKPRIPPSLPPSERTLARRVHHHHARASCSGASSAPAIHCVLSLSHVRVRMRVRTRVNG